MNIISMYFGFLLAFASSLVLPTVGVLSIAVTQMEERELAEAFRPIPISQWTNALRNLSEVTAHAENLRTRGWSIPEGLDRASESGNLVGSASIMAPNQRGVNTREASISRLESTRNYVSSVKLGGQALERPGRSWYINKDAYNACFPRVTFSSLNLFGHYQHVGLAGISKLGDSGGVGAGLLVSGEEVTAPQQLSHQWGSRLLSHYDGTIVIVSRDRSGALKSQQVPMRFEVNWYTRSFAGFVFVERIGAIRIEGSAQDLSSRVSFVGDVSLNGSAAGEVHVTLYGSEGEELGGTFHISQERRGITMIGGLAAQAK